MKIQRFIRWGSIVSLGLFGMTSLGIACWLYAWRWRGTPEPHGSLAAHEVRMLREYDDFLVSTAVANERMKLAHWWKEYELDNPDSWLVKLSITLAADWISKRSYAPHRERIHSLLLNNDAQQINSGLAFLALCKKDVPLFKMLVNKASGITSPHEMEALLYSVAFFVPSSSTSLPVKERLELLDWLHEKKDVIHLLPPHRVLEAARTLPYSDDKTVAVLDWFLRKGCKLNPEGTLALMLSQPEALPTLQKLTEDGLLPPPPQTLAPYLECSPLQLVAGPVIPVPDTVRWNLRDIDTAVGYDGNVVPLMLELFGKLHDVGLGTADDEAAEGADLRRRVGDAHELLLQLFPVFQRERHQTAGVGGEHEGAGRRGGFRLGLCHALAEFVGQQKATLRVDAARESSSENHASLHFLPLSPTFAQ